MRPRSMVTRRRAACVRRARVSSRLAPVPAARVLGRDLLNAGLNEREVADDGHGARPRAWMHAIIDLPWPRPHESVKGINEGNQPPTGPPVPEVGLQSSWFRGGLVAPGAGDANLGMQIY